MAHVQSSRARIYFTKDYSRFSFIRGNRDISQKKVDKLIASIESGLDLLPYCPIIVSETMKIIDGQHRFYVSKSLGKPVHYVMCDVTDIRRIAEMNSNTDKWKMKDFVNWYIDLGTEDYKVLAEYKKRSGFSYGVSAVILSGCGFISDGGNRINADIEDGKFRSTDEDNANSFLDEYSKLISHTDRYKDRKLISCMQKLYGSELFDNDVLIKKLKSSGYRIEHKATIKMYLSHIEELYNFKSRDRVIIYQ